MELTEGHKALFSAAARALTGSARRVFMARTVRELGPGGQRRAERELGWDRGTIRKGGARGRHRRRLRPAGPSVTNMAEYLAAEIVARHFPHLLDTPAERGQPVVWLEQYPPGRGTPGEYDRVAFTPWRIRAVWLGGTLRRALATPARSSRAQAGVAALLGPMADAGE